MFLGVQDFTDGRRTLSFWMMRKIFVVQNYFIHKLNTLTTECSKGIIKGLKATIVWHGAWFRHGYHVANKEISGGTVIKRAVFNGEGVFKIFCIFK